MSLGPPDRVVAEAVIAWERIDPNLPVDQRADQLAREFDGDFEHKVIARAKAMSVSAALTAALRHLRQSIALVIVAGVVLAMVGGAATARAALGAPRDEPVNFLLALGALLGPQTIFLLFWIVLMIAGWRRGGGLLSVASLGGLLVLAAQQLATRLHRSSHHVAAVAAISSVYGRGSIGKWAFSAISHALWLSLNIGCLVVVVGLLSARQYSFAWETTILSSQQYRPIITALAAGPRFAGFVGPTEEQIESSQWNAGLGTFVQDDETRRAWSGLLVGCIVVYGFAPRLLLLGWCLGQLRQARHRYRLDTSSPELLRLHARLMPVSHPLGLLAESGDGQVRHPHRRTPSEEHLRQRPFDAPAIVGFEIATGGAVVWPPPVHAVRWLDLGFVEGGEDQRRVLKQLSEASSQPRGIVVVCSLTATPDRGAGAFIADLGRTVAGPISLLLTGGQAMRRRLADAGQLERRVADWRSIAIDAGIERSRIIELDLDHWTSAGSAKLAMLLDSPGSVDGQVVQRQIENAFEVIASSAAQWHARREPPTTAEQAELHRQIARLYRESNLSWRELLGVAPALGADLPRQLRRGADHVIGLLPRRLSLQPRWLAAGAAAGALGCIAAATLVAPVAIASLPMWSAIGAALAAMVWPAEAAADQPSGAGDAVSAAALFAILLEVQGRGEAAITRILDQTLIDDSAVDVATARAWLDQVRHRLDLAIAKEPAE